MSDNNFQAKLEISAIAKQVGLRLGKAVDAKGGVARVADKSGVPSSSIYRWISGATAPPLKDLQALANACGVNITDFLVNDPDMTPLGSQRALPDTQPDGFTFIHRLDVEASAGHGRFFEPQEPTQLLGFRTAWLRKMGIAPNRAQALTAIGDSMEPTIRDGDTLLVDRSVSQIVDNGIYVMTIGGLVVVKRVQMRRDKSLLLISDNRERYEPELVPPDEVATLVIEGRVRWFGRTL